MESLEGMELLNEEYSGFVNSTACCSCKHAGARHHTCHMSLDPAHTAPPRTFIQQSLLIKAFPLVKELAGHLGSACSALRGTWGKSWAERSAHCRPQRS